MSLVTPDWGPLVVEALRNRVDEMEELVVSCEMNTEVSSGMEMGQLIARRAGVREALHIAEGIERSVKS